MPSPKHRTKRFRKVFIRTPSGKVKTSYRKRKPSKAKCSSCRALLKGVARVRAFKLKSIPKSKKTPSRPFSDLCSGCSRKKLKERIKEIK